MRFGASVHCRKKNALNRGLFAIAEVLARTAVLDGDDFSRC
jgi:hypothetical protein